MLNKDRKVVGLYEGEFIDSIHELLERYNKEEIDCAVIVFSRKRPDRPEKGRTTTRNFFGSPIMCRGLLKYADDYIEEWELEVGTL